MLARYNYSPINALLTAFPEHRWEIWRFVKKPTGYWGDGIDFPYCISHYVLTEANQRALFDRAAKKLNLQHWEEWYKVF